MAFRRRTPTRRFASTSPIEGEVRSAAGFGQQERLAAGLGEVAHAQDVALALGHRDHAARVEQVEDVARLDAWS